MRVRLFSLLSAFGLLLLSPATAVASTAKFDPPQSYYLALGDSLAFGFQEFRFVANYPAEDPAAFNTGYVDDFAAMLGAIDPRVQTVNYGCPGETTSSYMVRCQYQSSFRLHSAYPDSQMSAALAFLKAHPGQVSPITIDLGANDVDHCNFDPTCIQAAIGTVNVNMRTILGGLRAAAPSAEIIVMEYYNPFAVVDPSTNGLAETLNSVLAADASTVRADVADAFTPFNLAPSEPATLCALTLMCTAYHDIHASDAGYLVIAQQFWAASGYSRLVD